MLDFILNTENRELKQLCDEFFFSKRPKYILGRNEFAISISKNVLIDGFIDDFTNETTWYNKPIVPLEKVPPNAIIAVAVVYGRPLTAIQRIKKFNLCYIDYFSLLRYSKTPLLPLSYIDGFVEDFTNHYHNYQDVYSILSDEESKTQFINLINFRQTYDLNFMNNFKNIQDKQYFEPFIDLMPGTVFIDVGGFDGFTSYSFIHNCPYYKEIHFFEPDNKNIIRAKEKLKDYQNIFYYTTGVSNKNEILFFKSSGSSSRVDKEGDIAIKTQSLDTCIKFNNKPTNIYIKMDVEGWESKVIEGSNCLIKKYKPLLAVCVYHKCDDFWKIPQQVLSIRNDYKVFLRHYTEGITETVMYFV